MGERWLLSLSPQPPQCVAHLNFWLWWITLWIFCKTKWLMHSNEETKDISGWPGPSGDQDDLKFSSSWNHDQGCHGQFGAHKHVAARSLLLLNHGNEFTFPTVPISVDIVFFPEARACVTKFRIFHLIYRQPRCGELCCVYTSCQFSELSHEENNKISSHAKF